MYCANAPSSELYNTNPFPFFVTAATTASCSLAALISTASQLHAIATATVSTNSDRIENWNRDRNARATTSQSSMPAKTTATLATAISTVQPFFSLNQNH